MDTFEAVAIEELSKLASVYIIDEIGKMETLFSKRFNATVRKILDNPNVVVVGTVAMQGGGFIGEVRHSKGRTPLLSPLLSYVRFFLFAFFFLFCVSLFFFFFLFVPPLFPFLLLTAK